MKLPNTEKLTPFLIPLAIVIAGALIAGAVVITGGGFPNGKPSSAPLGGGEGPPSDGADSFGSPTGNIEVGVQDHIRGSSDAKVTIVEFSDLQCPFCASFHPTMQQILDAYQGQVRWVYKHFPLDQIHPEATPAAEASECVYEQKGDDGFWRFVDGVFDNQNRIGAALYRELAQQIGVNTAQFEDCIASRKYRDKVRGDYQEGVAAGVNGTPGSFVNGVPVSGAVPYSILEAEVKRALGSL